VTDLQFRSGLTFEKIAESINKPEVWTAAVFYGQAKVCSFHIA
jgi:cyanate lyase